MTEQELLAEVLSLCHEYGLLAHHCRDSRKCVGRGMPDLVIVGTSRTLFAELKSGGGDLTSMQVEWKWRLVASGCHWVCWSPKHLISGVIESVLADL